MGASPFIRTIYLYLFSIVGLILIIIGGVRLVDLGLKMFVFKQADIPYYEMPPTPISKLIRETDQGIETQKTTTYQLTDEEKQMLADWEQNYKTWKERESKIDRRRSDREREASNAIAMMIIGLPVFLYHWGLIQKEVRKLKESIVI